MTAKLRYICQNKKMVLNLFSVLWKIPTHGVSIEIDIEISYPKALEFIRKETGWPWTILATNPLEEPTLHF